ncbi:MAG: DUF4160 domain-containing protein [Fimbriimonadaceae bacterium]|nr:DUF4160 domain-containing protein [Fimbriimonadaceae bacterium]
MGRVETVQLNGLELLFYSNDHRPPHLHVLKRGAWEIRVYLLATTRERLSFDLKWGTPPSGRDQKRLRLAVDAQRCALLAEWEAKVDCSGDTAD